MAGETSLTTLLRSMSPQLNDGAYVFCSLSDAAQLQGVQPLGSFQEAEGLTVIVQRQQAEHSGGDQQGIANHAEQRHRQVMLAAQALCQDEGILCAEGDDQPGGDQ